MRTAEVLEDALSRVREVVHGVVPGLTADQLAYRPGPGANSICWLIWHLTRVQDDHVAKAFGAVQAWSSGGWTGSPHRPGTC